jgi:hypothetical protein
VFVVGYEHSIIKAFFFKGLAEKKSRGSMPNIK